jgi:hypothetical protein
LAIVEDISIKIPRLPTRSLRVSTGIKHSIIRRVVNDVMASDAVGIRADVVDNILALDAVIGYVLTWHGGSAKFGKKAGRIYWSQDATRRTSSHETLRLVKDVT